MRILMILIPNDGSHTTGPSVARVTEAYYFFRDRGVEVVLASPTGGSPWTRTQRAEQPDTANPAMERFRADQNTRDAFADTLSMDQVFVDDFAAAFCIGEIFSIWLPQGDEPAGLIVAKMLTEGKPVAIISGAVDVRPSGPGEGLLIWGRAGGSPLLAAQALLGAMRAK